MPDYSNSRVRMINSSGVINTIAGNGVGGSSGDGGAATSAQVGEPIAVAVDGAGNVYISQSSLDRVRMVNAYGTISTVAGNGTAGFSGDGGPATAAELLDPFGIAVDGSGNLYIGDFDNLRVRKVTLNNHPPRFTGGHVQYLTACEGVVADSINSLLGVIDSDVSNVETWHLLTAPHHGTAVIADSTISTGSALAAHNNYYKPTPGYAGNDTFKVTIFDGYAYDTTTIYVTVTPEPIAIAGRGVVCAGASITLSDTVSGGIWSSGSVGVATVGSASGIVTGVSSGVSVISYTVTISGCGTVMSTKTITVNPSPGVITGVLHVCMGSTTTLGNSVSGGVWSSGSPGIAAIGSASGVVSGVSVGVAAITYTLAAGCTATANVSVNLSPSSISGSGTVCAGSTTTLTDATTGGLWSTTATGIASIGSASGIVSGLATGTAVMTYSLADGCFATQTVTVNASPAAITGIASLCVGSTTTLYDGGGIWSSGSPAIAVIGSSMGIISGVSAGNVTISYTLPDGCLTTTIVTVNPIPSPISGGATLCLGLLDTLTDTSSGGYWGSSDYTVAYIDAGTGIVTGLGYGAATITYTLMTGCYATMPITVNPAPTVITGVAGVCTGGSTTLFDGVTGGMWSSAAPAIATINPVSGVYSGVAAGTTVMSYSMGAGCFATFGITVYPIPLPITGTMHLCPGATTTLADVTVGGTWSSSVPGVATVGSGTGLVAGLTAGVTTISYSFGLGVTCAATAPVTVNPLPSAISGVTHACPGTTTASAMAGGNMVVRNSGSC